MSYFQPSEAPKVHIELLPDNAKAYNVKYLVHRTAPSLPGRNAVEITAWSSTDAPMNGKASMDPDSFVENYCYDCPFYAEDIQYNATGEGIYVYVEGEECEVIGDIDVNSPCPCYANGLDEVSWPCPKDHDYPSMGDDDDTEDIELKHMSFAIRVDAESRVLLEYAFVQRAEFVNNVVVVSNQGEAVNCYGHDGHICWGGNSPEYTLNAISQSYSATPCNQDLTEFDTHNGYVYEFNELDMADTDDPNINREFGAVWLGEAPRARPTAVVVAAAADHPQAYLMLATSGAYTANKCAYVTATFYKNLPVDDDFVADVYVTDVLSSGVRLVFYPQDSEDRKIHGAGVFIGQVPANFSLPKCNSNLPSSSALAALVSN